MSLHSTQGGRWHKFHRDLGETLVGLLRSNTVLRHSDTPHHVAYFIGEIIRFILYRNATKFNQFKYQEINLCC